MKLSHQIKDQIAIITVEGELLGDAVISFEAGVLELLEHENLKAVVVNLEKIMFLDSFGIGVTVNLFKKFQQAQMKFGLCALTKEVLEAFKITCLDQLIPIYETKQEALKSFTE